MNVDSLLQKSFLFGLAGIISCMVPANYDGYAMGREQVCSFIYWAGTGIAIVWIEFVSIGTAKEKDRGYTKRESQKNGFGPCCSPVVFYFGIDDKKP